MNDRTFVDSNILIYAHDADAKSKHEVAKRVLMELWEQGSGVLSMQVLQEFYVNVTRKIASPLSKKLARTVINSYAIWCVETTPARNFVSIANRGRIPDRILGCDDRRRGAKEWSRPNSVRGPQCWADVRWCSNRKSVYRVKGGGMKVEPILGPRSARSAN